jgi:hypothetical protein
VNREIVKEKVWKFLIKMNSDSIFKQLPSYPLLQFELITSLSHPVICHLLKKFGLEDAVEKDSDLEDLQGVLFAFISSFDGPSVDVFHRLYEILTVFPGLDFELVQSLLESTEGKMSKEMTGEFVELSAGEHEEECVNESISIMSLTQLLGQEKDNERNCHYTLDRKTVLIITDGEEGANGIALSGHVAGVAMRSCWGLNAVYAIAMQVQEEDEALHDAHHHYCRRRRPGLEWGLHDLHVCYRATSGEEGGGAEMTGSGSETEAEAGEEVQSRSPVGGELVVVTKQVYVTSVVFDYCMCLERVFDVFHYGWQRGQRGQPDTWTPALEEAMLHLLISVDDDLVMLVR